MWTRLRAASLSSGVLVLVLTAFNLAFRIGQERVQVWDESLYALSAYEMLASGDWIRTTLFGELDYYNAKPPLNVWLITLAFQAFGVSITTLRLPSIVAGWTTVALLWWWQRRSIDAPTATVAALVLSTCYGFLYVHSAREANTDALFTLLFLLTAITLWAGRLQPWRRAWLGPILAAVFLLRGMAVVMPVVFIALVECGTRRDVRTRWLPLITAAVICIGLITPWAVARWQIDGGVLFHQLFFQDFVARTTTPLDGHHGSLLFYLHVLQKNHYDWLIAAVVCIACMPQRWAYLRDSITGASNRPMVLLLASWSIAVWVIPTLTATKVAWYLNPFFPLFAAGVAWLMVRAWEQNRAWRPRHAAAIVSVAALAFTVAESKLAWHSYRDRDIAGSTQELILTHADRISGYHVYAASWDLADVFVLRSVGGKWGTARDADEFMATSSAGEFWIRAPGTMFRRMSNGEVAVVTGTAPSVLSIRSQASSAEAFLIGLD